MASHGAEEGGRAPFRDVIDYALHLVGSQEKGVQWTEGGRWAFQEQGKGVGTRAATILSRFKHRPLARHGCVTARESTLRGGLREMATAADGADEERYR